MQKFLLILCVNIIFCACSSTLPTFSYGIHSALKSSIEEKAAPTYPQAYFAVLSDTHIYDTNLGVDGKAQRISQ